MATQKERVTFPLEEELKILRDVEKYVGTP
jgi:hypothetical protein